MLDSILTGTAVFHAAVGLVALVAMWVPIVAAKGSRSHRLGGRVYVRAMAAVVGSALLACALRAATGGLDDRVLFLTLVAVLAGENTWFGVRVLGQKKRTGPHRDPIDLGFSALLAVAGFAGAAYGLWRGHVLFIAFGGLSLALGMAHLRDLRRAPAGPRAWLLAHLGNMLAACIATVTAFLVVNYAYAPAAVREVVPAVAVWIAPGILGGVGITLWTRRYSGKPRAGVN